MPNNNVTCFETGGSVATTAFDFAMRMECRRVIFLGLDLAYRDGQSHAKDTEGRVQVEYSQGKWVEGFDGNRVQTARNLDLYRLWIEKSIEKWRAQGIQTPVIDATEGGAKKKGMRIMTLQEAINQGK